MQRNQTMNVGGLAAQLVLGGLALALVIAASFRVRADLATAAFACLIVILVFSLITSFVASVLLSALAVAGLDYFFAPPVLQFAIDNPHHLFVLAAFFLSALLAAHLIGHVRRDKEIARVAEADFKRRYVALQESDQQWRAVFEHNPVMYFMVDAEGFVLNVNTFGATQLGYAVQDLVGQSVLTVFLDEDRAFVQKCVGICLENIGQSHTWEIRKIRKNGSLLWVRENAKAMRRSDGRVIVLIACEDVTERKATESALQQNEAYLAEAQRLSHTSSWAWDIRRRDFIYRSAEFFRLFGFDPEEDVPAKAIQDRIPPEDRQLQGEVIRQAAKQKDGELEFDFRILLPDGSIKRVHSLAHPVLDSKGEVSELIGTHMDVTEQYVAREKLEQALVALRESEQRFRDYAETASDWLWETGPDHRITQFLEHSSTAGVLGTAVIGLWRWQVASNSDADAEKWREHRAMLDAHLPFRDLVYRTEDNTGTPVYLRTSGKPFFDAGGRFLGYRGVSTDITAVIRAEQAEEALRKAQAELAHVTRVTTLGELAASIAHEINQPLAALIANAEACLGWLGRSPPDLGAARRSVEWIIDDANRASEVIRRVRALVQKTDTEKELLDINELVREAMALVQRELSKNEVSLRMELAPRLPSIYGDRVQLQQVIINLVMNGIEAMQSVDERPRRLAIRSGQDDLGRVFLTVADTGTGISEADAERIFTPFFTTKSSGMGMGLAICRSIVEAHAGRLSAVRNEEGGATFQFVLPLHHEDAA